MPKQAKRIIICNPTVMHTGTQLMSRALFKSFRTLAQVDTKRIPLEKNNIIIQGHLTNMFWCKWQREIARYRTTLIPLRHPLRVWESFKRRDRGCLRFFNEQWNNLLELVEYHNFPENLHFIHVDDLKLRDTQVEKLSEAIGHPLRTDWPITKVTGCHEGTHLLNLNQVQDSLIDNIFIDFYERTKNA